MAFNIPKGKDYTFSVTVLAQDSFLPQDLANLDLVNTNFNLMALDTLLPVAGNATITRVVDAKVNITDPDTYLNGRLSVFLPASLTSTLVIARGPKVDNYYPIPTYSGIMSVSFTDSTSDIVASIPEICVIPTGA
jgi:hypothetical protein